MPRRILEGNIVSDKADKTVTVLVERRYMHPVYKKYIKSSSKYAAHDETNKFKTGDRVQIQECRPISKSKRWIVIGSEAVGSAPKKEKPAVVKAPKAVAKTKAEKPPAAKKPAEKKPAAKKTKAKKD